VQRDYEETAKPVAWVNYQLLDHKSVFCRGAKQLKLWQGGRANPIGTCVDNLSDMDPTVLTVEFENLKKNILHVSPTPSPPQPLGAGQGNSKMVATLVEQIISRGTVSWTALH
jgi:hypothetical protein